MDKIKLKRTVKMKHVSKEGVIRDGNKIIYDDSWLHEDVLDEDHAKSMNKYINNKYRTVKVLDKYRDWDGRVS